MKLWMIGKLWSVTAALFLLMQPGLFGEERSTAFHGLWLAKDKDTVYDVAPCPDGLCGRVVGVKPHIDKNGKPDSTCGVQVLTLTKWEAEKQWWEGKVLDPKSKKQYPVTLELSKAGTPLMKVTWGLISFPDPWSRFSGTPSAQCEIR
ncbi:MAG: DUF2147 domain-containing protein [Bryobacteraceae bacterium]|nr:DUF2147 domain-containing protein [Bryobacteraceae bacterium]